ncbi:MAG: hypothetical protein EOO27_02650 [Comamonadaceae bacterium]|nr:MAG: hypothetical protein EOO27_02650 [Comamonadaceae bacterium]
MVDDMLFRRWGKQVYHAFWTHDGAGQGPAKLGRGNRWVIVGIVVWLGEGNFVLLASEGEFNGAPTAFYDLFRIENGKVAEHWDVVDAIPARDEWQNDNGKF